MAQILDGLKISNEIKQEIKTEVDKIKASVKQRAEHNFSEVQKPEEKIF